MAFYLYLYSICISKLLLSRGLQTVLC